MDLFTGLLLLLANIFCGVSMVTSPEPHRKILGMFNFFACGLIVAAMVITS